MNDLSGLGRVILIAGVAIAVIGVVLMLVGRTGPRLPGDVSFGGRNWKVFVPLGTSILVSLVLTILLNLFLRR